MATAAEKFQTAMGAHFGLDAPPPPPRRLSKAQGMLAAAFALPGAPPAQKRRGTGPGAEVARAGLAKMFSGL